MRFATFLIISVVLVTVHNGGAVPRVFPTDDDESLPIVHTAVGSIRGLKADDGDYSMFMGIPYAQVDPENLFGNAKPYPNFERTFDAFDDSSICPQREEFNNTIVGSLDCLHINVYVPESASDVNRLPVLVWIFGGGFRLGFPGRYLYGPSFLVRHDIIFVTLNYRLGPYGFMCLDIPEVPGNQGLKDQVMALKWIKENIEAFGGDSSKITIAGNSAGGMCADLHLLYGSEDDLYHKIIPQSGVMLVEGIMGNPDPEAPLKLAEFLNYTTSDVTDALAFLATVDPHQLVAATEELEISFIPCIENEFENVERYITDHPVNMGVPRVEDVEVLIGFNNDELYISMAVLPDIAFQFVDFIQFYINMCFDFGNEDDLYADMHEIVTHFYFADDDITAEMKQEVMDMSSDFFFNHPVMRTVKKYLDYGVQTMYLYMFSYSGGRNFSKHRLNITGGGATHADELGYLFDISYMEKPLDPEDQLIVDRMTEMWANFVKYGMDSDGFHAIMRKRAASLMRRVSRGANTLLNVFTSKFDCPFMAIWNRMHACVNPTPEPTELVPVLWQPVSRDKWHYLEIDSEMRVGTRPLHHRMAFLDLFYRMNQIYQRGYRNPEAEPEPVPDRARNLVLDISLLIILVLTYFL